LKAQLKPYLEKEAKKAIRILKSEPSVSGGKPKRNYKKKEQEQPAAVIADPSTAQDESALTEPTEKTSE
jgi:hypothetical protein